MKGKGTLQEENYEGKSSRMVQKSSRMLGFLHTAIYVDPSLSYKFSPVCNSRRGMQISTWSCRRTVIVPKSANRCQEYAIG